MEIQPIRTVTFYENLLCIYRNVSVMNKLKKLFVFLRVVTELYMVTAAAAFRADYHMSNEQQIQRLLTFSSVGNSLIMIIVSCLKSQKFVQLYKNLRQNHLLFKSNINYMKRLDKVNRNTILLIAVFFMLHSSSFIYFQSLPDVDFVGVDISNLMLYLYTFHLNVTLAFCDHRFIIEYITLYIVLTIMAEQLNVAVESIADIEKAVKENVHGQEDTREHMKLYYRVSNIYTNIKKVSKLFNDIYGIQITFMLASIVFYFIISLYLLTTQIVQHTESSYLGPMLYVISTCILLWILALLSRTAQRAQNLSATLRHRLATLLVHSLYCPSDVYYKATRDLIRLIVTRPIQTRAFGSIRVDMTLIPTCVLFFTYYVVIALQFNNVV